jgi:hypothetical protein
MTQKPALSPAAVEYLNRIAADRKQPPPVIKREPVYTNTVDCDWCRKSCVKSYRTKESAWLCGKCSLEHLSDCERKGRAK